MRVAVIVKSLQIGGMERAAINLANTFLNEGHETHLIYFKTKKQVLSPSELVKVHHFKLEYILKLTVIGAILNIFAKIMNALVRHSYFYFQGHLLTPIFKHKLKKLEEEYGKFDLVIVRGQGTFEMIWAYNNDNLILQQVNILRTSHSLLNDFFQRTIFSGKHIVCNAPSVFKELVKDFKISGVRQKSLKVIPSPIHPISIISKSEEYKPDINEKYIINIGRLVPVKNLSFLLDAYAYARYNLSLTHKLVIVGSGNLRSALQKQAMLLNISEFVHFTGSLSNPYPWLRCADLFVFSSKNEGLPNVLLESLACKTNIVSTRGRGGTIDIMSGDLLNNLTSFNTQEFAKKIIEVLASQKKINFEKHLEEYSPTYVVQEYNKFIIKR
ncbi:glycosyltransferase [Sulfurimonas sp. SAG-AH-194-C20]|nr:glycosyltransferase [Sulfurimonas sp. SAG-AH-194-C20]MDF1878457.1 glycosyltransferase [Sulfurimonas sp. SAG-AH-194-C20]